MVKSLDKLYSNDEQFLASVKLCLMERLKTKFKITDDEIKIVVKQYKDAFSKY